MHQSGQGMGGRDALKIERWGSSSGGCNLESFMSCVDVAHPSNHSFSHPPKQHNNLYLCSVTCKNSNVVLMLTYLYQLTALFQDYFSTLNEESIRDNFVIIYELLDETMDHGLPQSLDSTILRSFITQEGNRMADDNKNKPPVALTNAVSWRAEGIKHKKNEIFLDVVDNDHTIFTPNLLDDTEDHLDDADDPQEWHSIINTTQE